MQTHIRIYYIYILIIQQRNHNRINVKLSLTQEYLTSSNTERNKK